MRYILNADDFGRTRTVNQAIVLGFDHHYLDRTTIMVNMPFFEQAVHLSEEHGFKDKVGLHINLVSGMPLTEPIKAINTFCRKDGLFNGKIFTNWRQMIVLTPKEKRAVDEEIQAQIEKFIGAGFVLLHADSHGHVHTFPSMQIAVMDSLSKNAFRSIRISANLHLKGIRKVRKSLLNIQLMHFNSLRGNDTVYFDSLKSVLANMKMLDRKEGNCEIMLHPDIRDGRIHIGEDLSYEDIPPMIWENRV